EDRLLDLRSQRGLAALHVELPAVPGTRDRRPAEGAVGQGTALMRADPVDRRDHAVDVADRIHSALILPLLGSTRRQLAEGGQLPNPGLLTSAGPLPSSASRFVAPPRRAEGSGTGGIAPPVPPLSRSLSHPLEFSQTQDHRRRGSGRVSTACIHW